ncbi:MAG: hypothetical protein EB053_04250 [Chlamydiae bacterium]|nr:hypothetical protein [Chlamydiota bacterium]
MLSMISQVGTLFRSSSLRGNSSYVKTFFESKLALLSLYRPAPQQRFFHNSKLHNRVDFQPPIRNFQSHFLTNGQPPKNLSKEDLLVEALRTGNFRPIFSKKPDFVRTIDPRKNS